MAGQRRPLTTRQVCIFWGVFLLGLVGCHEPSTKDPAVKPAEDVFSPQPIVVPLRVRPTGSIPARDLGILRLKAEAMETTPDAVYVRVAVPDTSVSLPHPVLSQTWLTVAGDSVARAIPAGEGLGVGAPWIYIRFHGAQLPNAPIVHWHHRPRDQAAGSSLRIELVDVMDTPKASQLSRRFYAAAARWFGHRAGQAHGRTADFYRFAAAFTHGRSQVENGRFGPQPPGKTELDLLAGISSSLIGRFGASPAQGQGQAPSVSIKSKSSPRLGRGKLGPAVGTQPTPAFGTEEDGDLGTAGIWLGQFAPIIPRDAASFFLAPGIPMESLVAVLRDLSPYFELSENAGIAHVRRIKLVRKLAHLMSGLERRDGAASVLYSLDPSVYAGTDLTLVTRLIDGRKGSRIVRGRLIENGFTEGRRTRRRLGGITVFSHGQTGEKIFIGQWSEVLFVGNSRSAIMAALSSRETPGQSLASDPHFLAYLTQNTHMRTIAYGSLYIGLGAFRRFYSLPGRLRRARHHRARSELSLLEYAWQFARYLTGQAHKDAQTLLGGGFISQAQLTHGDDGSAMTLSGLGIARSIKWGSLRYTRPIADVANASITAAQLSRYQALSAPGGPLMDSNAYPVSVSLSDEGTEGRYWVDLWRSSLHQTIGGEGQSASLLPDLLPLDGACLTLSLPRNSVLRKQIGAAWGTALGLGASPMGALGDWIAIGLGETPGLYDAALALVTGATFPEELSLQTFRPLLPILERLPVYGIAPILDDVQLVNELGRIRAATGAQTVQPWQWATVGTHDGIEIIRVGIPLGSSQIGILFARLPEHLVWAFNGAVLTGLLDRIKAWGPGGEAQIGYARLKYKKPHEKQVPWLFQAMGLVYELWSKDAIRIARLSHSLLSPRAAPLTGSTLPYLRADAEPPSVGAYGTEAVPVWPPVPLSGSALDRAGRNLRVADIRVQDAPSGGRAVRMDIKWVWGSSPTGL